MLPMGMMWEDKALHFFVCSLGRVMLMLLVGMVLEEKTPDDSCLCC